MALDELGRLLAHPGPERVVPWSRVAVAEWARRDAFWRGQQQVGWNPEGEGVGESRVISWFLA